jgi:hypothetical protein
MSETKPYEKVAAFTKSPGVAQIASYVVLVLEVVLFYAVILPNLESSSQIALGILFSLTLLLLVISGSICSVVDPSDQAMVLYRNDREKYFLSLAVDSKHSGVNTMAVSSSATTA